MYCFVVVFCFYNVRFYIVVVFIFVAFEYVIFYKEFIVFFLNCFDCIQVVLYSIFINQWAYMVVFIQWVVDVQLAVGFGYFFFYFVEEVFVYNQVVGGGIMLFGCVYCVEEGIGEYNVGVSVWCNDDGVIVIQFQDGFIQMVVYFCCYNFIYMGVVGC